MRLVARTIAVAGAALWLRAPAHAQQPSPPTEAGSPPAGAEEVSPGPVEGAPPDLEPGTQLAGETNGVIVKLRSSGPTLSGSVVVRLGADGDTREVKLQDNGEMPDVNAGDGQWAGRADALANNVTVELTVSGTTYDGGTVSWDSDARQRDLDLTLAEDGLQATASQSQSAASQGTPAVAGDAPVAAGSAPTAPAAAGSAPAVAGQITPSAPPTPAAPSTSLTDGPAGWIALGALALSLFAIGAVAVVSRNAGAPLPLPQRLSEAGLLGPGTPAPSGGLSVWIVDDPGSAASALLTTLAQTRSVVVVADTGVKLPAVLGGPVFRAADRDSLADAVDAVVERIGGQVSVLLVGGSAHDTDLDPLVRELPEDVGGIVLTATPPNTRRPVVQLTATEAGYRVAVKGGPTVEARRTPRGLEV